jgi:hypothetical protein
MIWPASTRRGLRIDLERLSGESPVAYSGQVSRPALSILLALICSVQVPALAQASLLAPPQEVDARAEALFVAGKPLEAAQVFEQALNDLPERPDTRSQRNSWATGAVNAYGHAFELDTTRCATSHAGLALADAYLMDLVWVYGDQAKDTEDYGGMRKLRDALDQARAKTNCPAKVFTPGPKAVREEPAAGPRASEPTEPTEPTGPTEPRRRGPGLAVGVGVSAALTIGMAVGTGVLYSQLRKDDGKYYNRIQDAAAAAGVPSTDVEVDMCKFTDGRPGLATACQQWASRHNAYITTAVLTGVFAASTAVFTGLLIRQRRQSGSTAALLRRHQAQLGATPLRGGGVSLIGGFHF